MQSQFPIFFQRRGWRGHKFNEFACYFAIRQITKKWLIYWKCRKKTLIYPLCISLHCYTAIFPLHPRASIYRRIWWNLIKSVLAKPRVHGNSSNFDSPSSSCKALLKVLLYGNKKLVKYLLLDPSIAEKSGCLYISPLFLTLQRFTIFQHSDGTHMRRYEVKGYCLQKLSWRL